MAFTDKVKVPVFDGWKKVSILVMSRSNESNAFDPATYPLCLGNCPFFTLTLVGVVSRTSPSTAIE